MLGAGKGSGARDRLQKPPAQCVHQPVINSTVWALKALKEGAGLLRDFVLNMHLSLREAFSLELICASE